MAIIAKAFIDSEPPGLRGKMLDIVRGTNAYLSENVSSSNKARNTAFEVLVGARFKLAEYNVDFPHLADARVIFDNKEILIQCKRPSSFKQLHKNITDARRQLKASYRGPNRSRRLGMIAIDISKLVNPEFNLLVSESEDSIGDRLSEITIGFIKKHLQAKYTQIGAKNLGILIRYSGIALNRKENIYTYCQFYSLMSTSAIGSPNDQIINSMVERLGHHNDNA